MAEADQVEVIVAVDGDELKRLQTDLRMFAPKLLVQLRRQLAAAGERVTGRAGTRLASLQQTHGTYNGQPDDAASHYRMRTTMNLMQLYNMRRGAAMVENAGRTNVYTHTDRGRTLVATLNERYGRPGRVLWRAYYEQSPAMLADVRRLVSAAEDELTAQLNADSSIAAMPYGGM